MSKPYRLGITGSRSITSIKEVGAALTRYIERKGWPGSFTEQPLPLAIGLDEQGLFLAPNRGKALWPDSAHWHGTRKNALADAVLKARLVLDVNMELDVRIEGFDLPALAAVTR